MKYQHVTDLSARSGGSGPTRTVLGRLVSRSRGPPAGRCWLAVLSVPPMLWIGLNPLSSPDVRPRGCQAKRPPALGPCKLPTQSALKGGPGVDGPRRAEERPALNSAR